MDECEHLFHAPFTATGLIHLSELPLSFRLSDVHCNHSLVMDHSEPPPSCLRLCLCAAWSSPKMLPSLCVRGCTRSSAAHKCAFVNVSGRASSPTIVFFIETSGVFQKQVHKNKRRNVASRCSCPIQMVPRGRRVPSSPCHLLIPPTNCLLDSFYLSPSFTHTHKLAHSHEVLILFIWWGKKRDRDCCGVGINTINMVFL